MVLNKESDSMSANEYLRAQKLGEKRYQAAVAKNEYPYLPFLDEIISPSDTLGEVNLVSRPYRLTAWLEPLPLQGRRRLLVILCLYWIIILNLE